METSEAATVQAQSEGRTAAILSAAIVSHQSDKQLLRRTVTSFLNAVGHAQSHGLLRKTTLTLVDNSGSAEEEELLKSLVSQLNSPACELLLQSKVPNHGYGAANNRGIRLADSDFHLILNPDVELKVDTLSKAVAAMAEFSNCVMLTPRVEGSLGRLGHVAKGMPRVSTLLARALPGLNERAKDLFGNAGYELRGVLTVHPIAGNFLAGGCFLFCRTVDLKAAGGFDEGYFMYFEDFDLSMRLSGGKDRILFDPRVVIRHEGGNAARKGLKHILWFARSAIRFFSKYGWRL